MIFKIDKTGKTRSQEAKNQKDCGDESVEPNYHVEYPSDAENDTGNSPAGDAIEEKIQQLSSILNIKYARINQIEDAYARQQDQKKTRKELRVDPLDLRLVNEILEKVRTPQLVRTTFLDDILFKKIYELPAEGRPRFLQIRLLLNLIKLRVIMNNKKSGQVEAAPPRSPSVIPTDLDTSSDDEAVPVDVDFF